MQHVRFGAGGEEEGQINLIGVIISIGILTMAMAAGVAALQSGLLTAQSQHNVSQQASDVDAFAVRLMRDAEVSVSIYYPDNQSGNGCPTGGNCDDTVLRNAAPMEAGTSGAMPPFPAPTASPRVTMVRALKRRAARRPWLCITCWASVSMRCGRRQLPRSFRTSRKPVGGRKCTSGPSMPTITR